MGSSTSCRSLNRPSSPCKNARTNKHARTNNHAKTNKHARTSNAPFHNSKAVNRVKYQLINHGLINLSESHNHPIAQRSCLNFKNFMECCSSERIACNNEKRTKCSAEKEERLGNIREQES